MTLTKEKAKGIKYELEFTIPAAEFGGKLDKALAAFQAKHTEKGFRPGKVPMDVIRKKFEGAFVGDIINESINDAVMGYCKDKDIRPAVQPKVDLDGKFELGKDLVFKAEFEVIPTAPDIDFAKITVEKPVAKATSKEIDEAIKNIAESRRTSEEVARAAKKGDVTVIDFEGFKDGVAFEGGKGADYSLELGSNSFIPGFEDQLVGAKAGDDVEVKLTFPKDYGVADLANAKAVFKVKVKAVRELKAPAIDDALAVELKRKDLADLKTYVEGLLNDNYANLGKVQARDALLDSLGKTKMEIPEGLVVQEIDFMLAQHNHEHDEKTLEKERKELRADAESRVKLGLILADIGKKAGIKVEDMELRNAVMNEAMRHYGQEARVIDYYTKNPQAMDVIRAGIFEEKTLDYALEKALVKEKTVKPEELTKPKK